mmetsp:Transcript_23330/g.57411  ORF Transcript_23330/g.57411 Transcript_23330/m.57411 type:complete len:327 (+) Transcript_23330:93-1073(+)
MIIPPVSRDSPNQAHDDKFMTFDVRAKRMVTKYFAGDSSPSVDSTTTASSTSTLSSPAASSYQGGHLKYSFVGGIFHGLGTTLAADSSSAVATATANNSKAAIPMLGRIMLPGFLAFETHHGMSHALFRGVFQEDRPNTFSFSRTASSPIGYFENVLNYELHIVAGATAGLSYSLATSLLDKSFSPRTTATHMLSFAALFGGYDVYSDMFGSVLLQQDDAANTATTATPLAVALAGGCAGMTQAWVIDFRSIYMRDASTSLEMMSNSAAAARYATTTTTTTTATAESSSVVQDALTRRRMIRAFLPGAAAFSAYEWFGTLLHQQQQ